MVYVWICQCVTLVIVGSVDDENVILNVCVYVCVCVCMHVHPVTNKLIIILFVALYMQWYVIICNDM